MSSMAAIRDAVKTTLDAALTDVYLYDIVPDLPTLPAVFVQPLTADFDAAFGRGLDTWEFDLVVLTARGSDRAGQDKLDALVNGSGALSVRQAIFANRTLGLADVDAHVSAMTSYGGSFSAVNIDHYAASLRLVVRTNGTS
jgi:hypothetical protein